MAFHQSASTSSAVRSRGAGSPCSGKYRQLHGKLRTIVQRPFAEQGLNVLRFAKPTHTKPAPVAVISDAFRHSHFAGDPAVLGRTVRVDETTYTVVGVAPREFEGLELEVVDLWVPLSNYPGGMDGPPMLRLLARIEPGVDERVLDEVLTTRFRAAHASLAATRSPGRARRPR